jgi:hypothetical protein
MSLDHVHLAMPIPVASSFSGMGWEFLVNSDRHFLIFSPIQKELTYENVLSHEQTFISLLSLSGIA